MIIAFTGTHGSGKSTLAKQVAKNMGLPFITSKAGEIHRQLGVNASDVIDLPTRLRVQTAIVNQWVLDLNANAKTGCVFDRTPIDFSAYLLAEVPRDITETQNLEVTTYYKHCTDLCRVLPHILLCEPLSATVQVQNRGTDKASAANLPFMYKVHYLIQGILARHGFTYLEVPPVAVEQRVGQVAQYFESDFAKRAEQIIKERTPETWQSGFH